MEWLIKIRYYLIEFSRWLAEAIVVLWTYRIIVIAQLVLFFILWLLDQGQDLLVNLNDSHQGVIIFYVLITVMATMFWHLPKYLSKNTDTRFPTLTKAVAGVVYGTVYYQKEAPKDLNIARVLGVMTFLLPAFAVLNVLRKYGIPVMNPWLLWTISLVFYIILFHFNWIETKYRDDPSSRRYFVLAMLLCVVFTGLMGLFNHGRPTDLYWLCAGLCLMSGAFAIGVSIRRHLTGWLSRQFASRWVMMANIFLALAFLILNIFPYALISFPYVAISAFLTAVVFHVLLFSFLAVWTRVSKINITGAFIAFTLIMAAVSTNPFHEVRRAEGKQSRRLLRDHIQMWLMQRKEMIEACDSIHPYPVFIVNAYGGGIRAAAWTSLCIQRLDSAVRLKNPSDDFQSHVLAYSGASGGTIGASVLCALQADSLAMTRASLERFFQSDFLSPVLIGLTGRDFFFSTFGNLFRWLGIPMDDRAVVQEKTWERQFEAQFGSDSYGKEFTTLFGNNIRLMPLLFSNSTEIKKGLKGIAAPVVLNPSDFPGAVMINDLDTIKTFRLSTAAFMSARFPLISPAGKIDTANYFMDGGLKENSGAETARQVRHVLESVIERNASLVKKVKIFLLSLPNTALYAPEIKRKQIVQLTAPLQALETNWEGNTRVADSINRVLYKGAVFSLRPTNSLLKDEHGSYRAVLPLGWQLSSKAIERLKGSLNERKKEVDEVVKVFN